MKSAAARVPNVLSIAGSDPSGGAGIQADIKSISSNGGYAMSAVTALTAQNTQGVTGVLNVDTDFITAQLDSVAEDVHIDAIKIGMLSSVDIITAVKNFLTRIKTSQSPAPVVVLDPVMVATSGDKLIHDETAEVLVRELFPLASVITPNLDEAGWLIGRKLHDVADMETAAQRLLEMGAKHVLLKGGHLPGDWVVDLLAGQGDLRKELGSQRIQTHNGHGTGCTLSSAIAAHMALGFELEQAVESARTYILGAIAAGAQVHTGKGHGPLNHGFAPLPQVVFRH